MSASVSCVEVAILRRSLPTRRVSSTKTGISANAKIDSCQLSTIIPTIVAITVVAFETIEVAVLVTTFWTPPMSFEMRDCTSPVRVRVKNASDSRCRCLNTAVRRSCITRWPTWFERSVCHDAEDAGDDRDHDHAAGVDRERPRVRVLDRLQHTAEQERGDDPERRRDHDQPQDGTQPEAVGAEEARDALQVRPTHGRVVRADRPLTRVHVEPAWHAATVEKAASLEEPSG